MAVKDQRDATRDNSTRNRRLAASRARMKNFLADPQVAAQARRAMEADEPAADDVVSRARAGDYAEEAFVEGYGEPFVKELKSRHGG
jgi:hypothetical protein